MECLKRSPQDVIVLAKLISYGGRRPPMAQMAADLSLSQVACFFGAVREVTVCLRRWSAATA